MDLEEREDEELDTTSNANSGSSQMNCVFKSGLTVGKKILAVGVVATSVPLVLPAFVVASAIGLAVSMPCAVFYVSHTCTQNLMSKLLPKPTSQEQGPLLLEHVCFKPNIDDITHVKDEAIEKTENEMVGVNCQNNMMFSHDYGKGVLKEEEEAVEPELLHSSDVNYDVVQHNGSEKGSTDYFSEEKEEGETLPLKGEIYGGMEKSNMEKAMSGATSFDESEEFQAPFDFGVTTTIVLEECEDHEVKEGDIEEEEMRKETKGLLEKIRDEGRNDMRGEYEKGVQDIGPVVENMEVGEEEKQNLGNGDEIRNQQEDSRVCKEMVPSRNDDNKDIVFNEVVESSENARGVLELEVDGSNDSQKPIDETSESELLDGRGFQYDTVSDELIGDLLMEMQLLNTLVAEDLSEVNDEKTDTRENFDEEPEPTILQKAVLDDDVSDVNQEMHLHEDNKRMDSSDADAVEIAYESELHLSDENKIDSDAHSYTVDLHEESSNVKVGMHTDSMEVLVSSLELESRTSECSSEKNIVCPSEEVSFNKENIWKQINVIRKIIGYEATNQTSYADELKALYIFTGVEPPTFLKENPFDPAEINEKLHFLMSIVGIKTDAP
ncbi:uncharacterized protein [Cicer arietinum]|uniref:Uncharacterized protein LOC101503497 isoform X2 n=1 Tax=Cicer arietinum TaxID=3827 RepID=A0A1S3E282_CICAR|nr:uncharacterized protein LOC101503497 isoform X2 [Cicer arietinum]